MEHLGEAGEDNPRFWYQVKRALKAASTFVELNPSRRRGHILGCGVHEIAGEMFTVEGVGTMISNHVVVSVPAEPHGYGA
jgi:hypothetical protein